MEKNMTKKQKILFSDLDATLLNDSKDIEPGTREAIDEMLAQGHIFTACTGRPLASALGVVKMFGLDKEGCYVAAYNGGVLYDPFRQKVIAYHSVPIPVVRRMFGEAHKAGLYIHTYDRTRDDAVMACRRTPELDAYTGHTKLVPVIAKDVLERLKEAPAKMIVISLTDHERLRQFEKEQAGWAGECLNSFFSCEQYLEYCPAGISKGSAVKALCEYLDIPVEHSVAAGDERNDISMLQEAGTGAVPRNAYLEVKAYADYQCEKDNNEGAVGEVIRRFVLADG